MVGYGYEIEIIEWNVADGFSIGYSHEATFSTR